MKRHASRQRNPTRAGHPFTEPQKLIVQAETGHAALTPALPLHFVLIVTRPRTRSTPDNSNSLFACMGGYSSRDLKVDVSRSIEQLSLLSQ